jgi:hypothetical protein
MTRYIAFGALPTRRSLEQAAVQLRGLTTYLHETDEKAALSIDAINGRVRTIERLLNLRPLDGAE